MEDEEFCDWNRSKREQVVSYLEDQGIVAPNVGDWPAFEVAPVFGMWCVESKKAAGKIGWWAFAGDCPTDYVTENGQCSPRVALQSLVQNWTSYIPKMKSGLQPLEITIGDGSNLADLAELLESRVIMLQDWIEDDNLWKEEEETEQAGDGDAEEAV